MHRLLRQRVAAAILLVTGIPVLISAPLQAQDHVVSSTELNQAAASAAQTRQQHLEQLREFLSSSAARRALHRSHISQVQVQQAVISLDNDELARLSARAERAQRDLAAGSLTNEQLTYIVIALATAVIVIILVER
jgi:hypothetical protein